MVALLRGRMEAWIQKREQETGITNPMLTQGDWHGHKGIGPFTSSAPSTPRLLTRTMSGGNSVSADTFFNRSGITTSRALQST